MKIAVCATERSAAAPVSNRFGRAEYFAIYDSGRSSWEYIENSQDTQAAQGAGIQSAQKIIDSGATVLLALNVGPKAIKALAANKIKVYLAVAGKSLKEVVEMFNMGRLEEITEANVEGHWV